MDNNLREKIAELAYSRFESRGFTHGNDVEDWLLAESEITRETVDRHIKAATIPFNIKQHKKKGRIRVTE